MSQQIFCGILHIGEIYISSIFSCENTLLVQSSWVEVFLISFEIVEQLHYVFFCPCQCQILLSRPFSFFANEFFQIYVRLCIHSSVSSEIWWLSWFQINNPVYLVSAFSAVLLFQHVENFGVHRFYVRQPSLYNFSSTGKWMVYHPWPFWNCILNTRKILIFT